MTRALLLVLLLVVMSSASGQPAAERQSVLLATSHDSSTVALAERSDGSFVFVLLEGHRVPGTVASLVPELLSLSPGSTKPADTESIQGLWTIGRSREGAWPGLLIGTLIGGVTGTTLGYNSDGAWMERREQMGADGTRYAVIGCVAGSLLGHLISSGGRPVWKIWWRRPPITSVPAGIAEP